MGNNKKTFQMITDFTKFIIIAKEHLIISKDTIKLIQKRDDEIIIWRTPSEMSLCFSEPDCIIIPFSEEVWNEIKLQFSTGIMINDL